MTTQLKMQVYPDNSNGILIRKDNYNAVNSQSKLRLIKDLYLNRATDYIQSLRLLKIFI